MVLEAKKKVRKSKVLADYKSHVLNCLTSAKFKDYPDYSSFKKNTLTFSSSQAIYAPTSTGVYFIHDLRGILYVGLTNNFRERLKQHTWIRKNKHLLNLSKNFFGPLKFSWVEFSSYKEAKRNEKKWIKVFNPICNETLFLN